MDPLTESTTTAGSSTTDSLAPTASSSSSASPEPALTSPPAVYTEPNLPDPFLVDSDECEEEDEEEGDGDISASQQNITAAHEISLAASIIPQSPVAVPPPILINKDVPPPPPDSDADEEEAPEIYLPGLIAPTMFLPIPNTDPLTTLLAKYIHPPEKRPQRDLSGEWQSSNFHTLVMTNSWRALAKMARDRLVAADPEDLPLLLGLWYLRLSALARLRLFNQTSAECNNLFSVLNSLEPVSSREWLFERILPFELEVMHTRLKYWAGDPFGYLDDLSALHRKCKAKARLAKADDTVLVMWKERAARLTLIMASQLIEMKEYSPATRMLESLCAKEGSWALRSAVARIYLQAGYLERASSHFADVAGDPSVDQTTKDMNAALLASAFGRWEIATAKLQDIYVKDPENFTAVDNLSVTLLSQGRLKEGIDVLEAALKTSPSSVVIAEPFLFNLSTLYELRSTTASQQKLDLLVEVAKWSGDGLRTNCLKMPTS